ncbi:hypothetical protein RF11_14864 [Thelohanellus kitauei]|uniref:Uncharacterized protein n=1 Tax=Thelohanellus kitauei TaxID=669202 RepID=A0A0C2MTB6_THEKT|nr:hypothetical protein RF11_14864 [Thelohanellus kitauei]
MIWNSGGLDVSLKHNKAIETSDQNNVGEMLSPEFPVKIFKTNNNAFEKENHVDNLTETPCIIPHEVKISSIDINTTSTINSLHFEESENLEVKGCSMIIETRSDRKHIPLSQRDKFMAYEQVEVVIF